MKTKFLKVVALATVLTLLLGVLAGCASGEIEKDEQGRIKISVGGWPDKEGKQLDNMNARKALFEEENTDVVIEPDLWRFERKTFYAKAAGGQLPMVYGVQLTEMPEIINSEYASDLSGVLKERGYEGMFNENVLDIVGTEDGKIYGFPRATYVLGLGVNTELFEAAGLMEADGTPKQPKDWYEVAEFAVKIKEATGKPGFVFPSSAKFGGWIFTPVAWSFGVDFMEKDENGKWHATFNTQECVDALQYIKDLKWKYDILPANTIVDSTEYYKVFATGGAGMLITAGDYPTYLAQYGMDINDIGMVAMPAGPKRHVTLLGGASTCIKAGASKEQIDAAIRWIETEYNYQLTDAFKQNKIAQIDKDLSEGKLVGIKSLSPWSENAETLVWENKLIDEKANSNPNHIKLYNDFVANCPAEIQAEEPVCAQELYETLDACIQEVLVNKNADCAQLIANAAADFQANYLDNLAY